MRNKSKITTLESKFPLLSVEQGCMVSKDADITVAFRVELPELFTVTSIEYEAMHSAWHKAIKVLPNYSIVHKQDWFIKEDYQGKLSDGGLSFLPVPLNGTLMNVPISTTRSISSLPRPTSSVWHSRAIFLRSAVDTSFPRKSPTRTK